MNYLPYFQDSLEDVRQDWRYVDLLDLVTSILPTQWLWWQYGKIPYLCLQEQEFYMSFANWTMINARIPESESKKLESYLKQYKGGMDDYVREIVGRGYKMSITWVDKANAFCVAVSGQKDHHINPKRTITSWSDDYIEAAGMCLYKINVTFQDGIWEDTQRSGNWG